MLVSNAEHWTAVTGQLKAYINTNYPTNYYFDGYNLNLPDLMSNLSPKQAKFFGPKVLNIFIVGYPYSFPIDKTLIKDNYDKWTRNYTYFWADKTLGDRAVTGDPTCGPALKAALETTFAAIKADCEGEMKDYGWSWKGDITSLVGYEFFLPVIDAFYAL